MRGEIEKRKEKMRKQTRLRVRRYLGLVIVGEMSVYDIPSSCELSKYWRRWSDVRRDVDAACHAFWAKRKGKNAYINSGGKFQRKKFFGKTAMQNN